MVKTVAHDLPVEQRLPHSLRGGTPMARPMAQQDAVQADPGHYTVEFENERVRVLRVRYGPHEKSVMHAHPATEAVFLTDGDIRFNFPNGRSEELHVKAGQTHWDSATLHLPENLSDKPFEAILTELKG
jgi:quercetin dioxygenase-like cupin family protein